MFDVTRHCGLCVTGALCGSVLLRAVFLSVPAALTLKPRTPEEKRHVITRAHGRMDKRQNLRVI